MIARSTRQLAAASRSTTSSATFATAISVGGSSSASASATCASISTPFARAFALVASIAASSRSIADHGREPELRGGDREHAGPAADVEQRSPARRSCSSSRQSRVVGCAPVPKARPGSTTIGSSSGRRILPRRPDPEAADGDAVVELPPRVLPSLAHVVGLDDVEADRRLVGVDRERAVELLHAFREEVQEERELRLAADDRRTASAERALQLLEEAFVGLVRVLVGVRVELREQAPLVVGEATRDERR